MPMQKPCRRAVSPVKTLKEEKLNGLFIYNTVIHSREAYFVLLYVAIIAMFILNSRH